MAADRLSGNTAFLRPEVVRSSIAGVIVSGLPARTGPMTRAKAVTGRG